jgi:phosphatidylserine/phosphatidylglycerophosphate/cardiolipin synthase-like enzyme
MRWIKLSFVWLGLAVAIISCSSIHAELHQQSWQIIETIPSQTSLQATAPPAVTAIASLIESAQSTIDLEGFYFANRPGSQFATQIVPQLMAKAHQGVMIRMVFESAMATSSLTNGLAALAQLPNVQIVFNNYFRQRDGIVHAKLLIVDRQKVYLGSHNWDWIAFELNHEVGVVLDNPQLAGELTQVFEADFKHNPGYQPQFITPVPASGNWFVATSPNFPGLASEIDNLVQLINHAQHSIVLQSMLNQNYEPELRHPQYWRILQEALINAAKRGVQVRVMVANWEFAVGASHSHNNRYLARLAATPNLEVRYTIFSQNYQGQCLPFSGVDHAKFMVVDGQNSWIGTGNLAQSYFTQVRDFSIFVRDNHAVAQELSTIFNQIWNSNYSYRFVKPITYQMSPDCKNKLN